MQARNACVAHLTCNGAPAGCDIDPTDEGPQACHIASAEALCDQVVLAPALAALNDLSNGPGAAQPQRDGSTIEYLQDPANCEPLVADTDDTPVCDEGGGGGGGADESSGGAFATEDEARRDVVARGNREAVTTCVPAPAEVTTTLVSAVAEPHTWHCSQREGGFSCGFDGEAVCRVRPRRSTQREICQQGQVSTQGP